MVKIIEVKTIRCVKIMVKIIEVKTIRSLKVWKEKDNENLSYYQIVFFPSNGEISKPFFKKPSKCQLILIIAVHFAIYTYMQFLCIINVYKYIKRWFLHLERNKSLFISRILSKR